MRFIVRALAVSAVALPLVAAAQGAPKPPQTAGGGKTELTWSVRISRCSRGRRSSSRRR
jgi:hypothetical protein